MARTYRAQRPYRDLDGEPPCVLCKSEPSSLVIFPCEHKCMCQRCATKHGIGDDWPFCPLCMAEIKRVYPHDGHEREKYWAWVYEYKPKLPHGFEERFEFAGAYLRQPPDDHTPDSCFCSLS